MPKCLHDLFIHLQAGTDNSSSPKGRLHIVLTSTSDDWNPTRISVPHIFQPEDQRMILRHFSNTWFTKGSKNGEERGDALSNTSLNSVIKVAVSFVVFPDWSLISKSQKNIIEGETKGKSFPETVFLQRTCYHGKENLHFMLLKS